MAGCMIQQVSTCRRNGQWSRARAFSTPLAVEESKETRTFPFR